jgi:hypothetical protein
VTAIAITSPGPIGLGVDSNGLDFAGRVGVSGKVRLVGTATLGPRNLGRRETQGRTNFFGRDFDATATLAVLRLPAALLEATRYNDTRSFPEAQRYILGEIPPAHNIEERCRLFPCV